MHWMHGIEFTKGKINASNTWYTPLDLIRLLVPFAKISLGSMLIISKALYSRSVVGILIREIVTSLLSTL